jgi:protein BCP1
MVDVEFEWFNFDETVDFHGVKNLARQLFDCDQSLLDLSGIADLIVKQGTIGSTVKVDGKANDAYAFLTVLGLATHAAVPAVAQLSRYLADKAGGVPALAPVAELLRAGADVGLVISERMINMPDVVAAPMYSMLLDEVEAAVEDGEPYAFTHWLVLSRMYREVESDLPRVVTEAMDDEDGEDGEAAAEPRSKRAKGAKGAKKAAKSAAAAAATAAALEADQLEPYFHPEDKVLRRHALAHGEFEYTKRDEVAADSRRAFQEAGTQTYGLMVLVEAAKFGDAVAAVNDYLKPPGA